MKKEILEINGKPASKFSKEELIKMLSDSLTENYEKSRVIEMIKVKRVQVHNIMSLFELDNFSQKELEKMAKRCVYGDEDLTQEELDLLLKYII